MHLGAVGTYPLTIGAILAFLVLVASVVFFIVGVPDPKTLLVMVGLLALARLL